MQDSIWIADCCGQYSSHKLEIQLKYMYYVLCKAIVCVWVDIFEGVKFAIYVVYCIVYENYLI